MRRKNKRLRGLTIVELLVVMAIIGLLVFFSAIGIRTQIERARDAERKSDLEKIKIALYDYFFDNDCFPVSLPNCGERLAVKETSYLNDFPCDPNGNQYSYQVEEGDCGQWFRVFADLENRQDAGIEKVGCDLGCGPDCVYNYGLASTNVQIYEGCPEEEESPGEDCFIATAVYESPSALEIDLLRDFRDEVLLETGLGRQLVDFYYRNSPPLAEFIIEHPFLKVWVRKISLDPLIEILKLTTPNS